MDERKKQLLNQNTPERLHEELVKKALSWIEHHNIIVLLNLKWVTRWRVSR